MKKLLLLILPLLIASCGTSTTPTQSYDKPSELTAAISGTRIKLRWTDNSNAEIGFELQKKIGEAEFFVLDTIPSNLEYCEDFDVSFGSNYTYRIKALFSDFSSDWSNETQIQYNVNLEFGTDSTFDVITWNIQYFPKEQETTVFLVKDFILMMDADIVCLQEIESASFFVELIAELNYYDPSNIWNGFRDSTASYEINLALIYKETVLSNVEISNIYSSYQYRRPFPRPPLLIEADYENERIYLINNHLKSGGDGILDLNDSWDDETRRFDAANLLKAFIDDSLDNENVILVGDLNDELTDEMENNVFSPFLNDEENYYFADLEIAENPSTEWSYPSWPSHLDHILITNELFDAFDQQDALVLTIKLDKFFESWQEYDDLISDHRPVGLKLSFE